MGGCGSKAGDNEVIVPQNHREQIINQQFSQFLRLDHPLNVNLKYTAQFTIQPDQFIGLGIKKTNAYTSRLSITEMQQKRKEFWETRTEGRAECWQAIKLATESEEQDALAILAAADLKLVNRTIQIVYDAQGHKYDIPIFCINEPISYPEVNSYEIGLKNKFNDDEFKIQIRSTKFNQDLQLNITTQFTIEQLKSEIKLAKKDIPIIRMRLFFGGREMQDHHKIGNYDIGNASVVQAFIF